MPVKHQVPLNNIRDNQFDTVGDTEAVTEVGVRCFSLELAFHDGHHPGNRPGSGEPTDVVHRHPSYHDDLHPSQR